MRLYVFQNGEKMYLPPEATSATRLEFFRRIGGKRYFTFQGNVHEISELRAESDWTNPAPGALVGGLLGALGGPAGAIIGAILGGAAGGSPSEQERARVKRFNESYV